MQSLPQSKQTPPSLREASAELRQLRPIRLWQIFPLIFITVYLTHWTLLRLPYYWDEAGYYIPAAYDFLRTGSLVPFSTLSNAHPPLPSLYLALWWKASGFIPYVTRIAMCMVASIALLGVYQLVLEITKKWMVASAVTILTLAYPVWFAQSTLAHADLFAAAATLWALCFYFQASGEARCRWLAALFFSLAALSKETAIVTPLALAISELCFPAGPPAKDHSPGGKDKKTRSFASIGILLMPLLPLAAWYAYHRIKTGFVFGNPEYLRYNATSTLDLMRIAVALAHRSFHLSAHMNLFVPVLCTAAAWILAPRVLGDGKPIGLLSQSVLIRVWSILIANLLFFSILGGALLTRYLLPLYPLVLMLCVWTWYRRVLGWGLIFLLSSVAFILGIFINPPYHFSPEDNLGYRDMIVLDQQAISQIYHRYPHASILTAWPVTDELTKPELGYVRKPYNVVAISDFTLASIQRAGESNANFTVGLVFSTKYEPPHLPFSLGEKNRQLDEHYFNGHQDLDPESVARLLGGQVVWQGNRNGQWAAVLHFDRPQLAAAPRLAEPPVLSARF